MKKFWKEYCDLTKESMRFCKRHWLGMLIMYIICFLTAFASYMIPTYFDEIKTKFKSLFKKETEEES